MSSALPTHVSPPTIVVAPRGQLFDLVRQTIAEQGPDCSLNHLDVSHVKQMNAVFADTAFNGDISRWETSQVLDMSYMFRGCPFNGDISQWNTGSLAVAEYMFARSGFNGDLSGWNTARLQNTTGMFEESIFNGSIASWDTWSMHMVARMFAKSQFNGDLSSWNLHKAFHSGNAKEMFAQTPYEGDLSSWRVPHAYNMEGAFSPVFKGILPAPSLPTSKGFYEKLFGSSKQLNKYLRTQSFTGAHFDVMRKSQSCPQNLDRTLHAWCRTIAKTGEALGLDDAALRAYAVQEYQRMQMHGSAPVERLDIGSLLELSA